MTTPPRRWRMRGGYWAAHTHRRHAHRPTRRRVRMHCRRCTERRRLAASTTCRRRSSRLRKTSRSSLRRSGAGARSPRVSEASQLSPPPARRLVDAAGEVVALCRLTAQHHDVGLGPQDPTEQRVAVLQEFLPALLVDSLKVLHLDAIPVQHPVLETWDKVAHECLPLGYIDDDHIP